MSTFVNANFGSDSDTDDEDFVPGLDPGSGGEDGNDSLNKKGEKRKTTGKAPKRKKGGIFLEGEDLNDNDDDETEAERWNSRRKRRL